MFRSGLVIICRSFCRSSFQQSWIPSPLSLGSVFFDKGNLKQTVSRIHTSCVQYTLDKDVVERKHVLKTAHEAKMEHLIDLPDNIIEGLSDAGTVIPTLETFSMLVDGMRYDQLPIVHIKSSPNNTIMCCTNHTGQQLINRNSCGQEGFRNVKKSTNVAAQATGFSLGYKLVKLGVKNVKVAVKGLGAGRLASIKGLQMAGVNIVSITDRTHIPRDGPKPRKARRL